VALVNCSECNREVSDSAASCPGCGHPLHPSHATSNDKPTKVVRTGGKYEGIGFLLIVIGIFMGIAGQSGGAGIAIGVGLVVFLIGRFK
jgi:hypothetical protein